MEKLLLKICFVLSITFLFGCGDDTGTTPKPRAYPKIEFPEQGFQKFVSDICPYKFEYPVHARVVQDTLFFKERPTNNCWFNIEIKALNSQIHCTYYPIDQENSFEKLRKEAFRLANEHNIKADYIDELPIKKDNGVDGFVFDIEGPVASPFQFYLTDSTNHFLRGSIYFNNRVQADSMAPVYEYMKKDVMHLINTFEWK